MGTESIVANRLSDKETQTEMATITDRQRTFLRGGEGNFKQGSSRIWASLAATRTEASIVQSAPFSSTN